MLRVVVSLVCLLATHCLGQTFDIVPDSGTYDIIPDEESSEGLIVGGQNANIEDFPYQVSLMYNSQHICGGSIVSKCYIVTAAHCTNRYRNSTSSLSVRVGSSLQGQGGQVIAINKVTQHPQFSASNLDYDVSILKLSKCLTYSATKKPITLATSTPRSRTMATVTGWGRLSTGGPTSYQLQKVEVPIVSQLTCSILLFGSLTNRMLCAGYFLREKGVCNGDSGGPLTVGGQLVGIVSWGRGGCASGIYPAVYASVPQLRSFITSNVVFD